MFELGVCGSINQAPTLAAAGVDYLEENVQAFLAPEKDGLTFTAAALPISAACCFLPGALKCVGPVVDAPRLLRYGETAFRRARDAGIEIIVFGSGGARTFPDGWTRERAREQFIDALRQLGPLAQKHSVTIVVEPLNRAECNFINSLAEGANVVRAAAHPNVRLLADAYHMLRDGESYDEILKHGALLRHAHLAENSNRAAPGVNGEDFRPFFRALARVGYQGRVSIECSWKNFEVELPAALACLRQQLAEVTG